MDLSIIEAGDVVAIIGDFNPSDIYTLLRLIDLTAIIVPLTIANSQDHEYFFEAANVSIVIRGGVVKRRLHIRRHILIDTLRERQHAGLILFSSGTTGRPKAILHDLTIFLARYITPRPSLRTINFLLFDHIGGINTLFHTLFNGGVVVVPLERTVNSVLQTCKEFQVEVLPTTPTFLRLMLMAGAIPYQVPECIKVITYGTERMDQATLNQVCDLLPNVDFRQTYGMSELGIVRVKSKARNSLFMKVGGEGIETRVVNNTLQIRSNSRMLGYLNYESPFDADGWYDTGDIVEVKEESYKITGRINEVINVGGLKFMASEVEQIALSFPNVSLVKVLIRSNPITGQHIELLVQPTTEESVNKNLLMAFLRERLQPYMVPKRIRIQVVNVSHRFKRT
jgi:acyl-CoA synthetase (AMP-forming)/AMP-acid ligase II